MSTQDDLLIPAFDGTARRYADEERCLADSILELRRVAAGRNDLAAQAAGVIAGSWFASPATHVGHELIAAGMLILAGGGRDYGELHRWVSEGSRRAGPPQYPCTAPSAPEGEWAEGQGSLRARWVTHPTSASAHPRVLDGHDRQKASPHSTGWHQSDG